ncbi:hypothetical protein, partial [Streptococcus hyointestinalis]
MATFLATFFEIKKESQQSKKIGSLSTVVGDEKLCAREDDFRSLSFDIQSDENLSSKVLKVTKSKRLS